MDRGNDHFTPPTMSSKLTFVLLVLEQLARDAHPIESTLHDDNYKNHKNTSIKTIGTILNKTNYAR
jgi:hypothetical protein